MSKFERWLHLFQLLYGAIRGILEALGTSWASLRSSWDSRKPKPKFERHLRVFKLVYPIVSGLPWGHLGSSGDILDYYEVILGALELNLDIERQLHAFKRLYGVILGHQGPFWAIFKPSWSISGSCWDRLGPSWGHFGYLRTSWAILRSSGAKDQEPILAHSSLF